MLVASADASGHSMLLWKPVGGQLSYAIHDTAAAGFGVIHALPFESAGSDTSRPLVAMSANGSTRFVWANGAAPNVEILSSRTDASGAQVTTPVSLAGSTGNYRLHDLRAGANGQFHAVWDERTSNDQPAWAVRQASGQASGSWSLPAEVGRTSIGSPVDVRLTPDLQEALVSWYWTDESGGRIGTSQISGTKVLTGAIALHGLENSEHAFRAARLASGKAALAWVSAKGPNGWGGRPTLRVATWQPGSTAIAGEQDLGEFDPAIDFLEVVPVGSTGFGVLYGYNGGELTWLRFDSPGSTPTKSTLAFPFSAPSMRGSYSFPQWDVAGGERRRLVLASEAGGNVLLVSCGGNGGLGVFRYNAATQQWSTDGELSVQTGADAPRNCAATTSASSSTVFWTVDSGGGNEIRSRSYPVGG